MKVMEGLRKEFEETQIKVSESVFLIQDMINELQHIALRPSIYHADEYFDIMIEGERREKQPGWQQRIKSIEDVKQRSKFCNDVKSDGYDPFAERVAQVKEQATSGKVNFLIDIKPKKKPPQPSGKTASSFWGWMNGK